MNREELFESWAPDDARWTAWAKPVLFATMSAYHLVLGEKPAPERLAPVTPAPGSPRWAPPRGERVALVIDLPGVQSVAAGLALARDGWRPVPLFNACSGPSPLIDLEPIAVALARAAPELRALEIGDDAPPAFLLDANRMRPTASRLPGKFDNRWVVFPQDFPSASYLHSLDIRGVVVVQSGPRVQDDLAHVLRRWQEGGIAIALQDPEEDAPARPFSVPRPSRFRATWYRVLAIVGLRRNTAGGFGGVIPDPSAGGG